MTDYDKQNAVLTSADPDSTYRWGKSDWLISTLGGLLGCGGAAKVAHEDALTMHQIDQHHLKIEALRNQQSFKPKAFQYPRGLVARQGAVGAFLGFAFTAAVNWSLKECIWGKHKYSGPPVMKRETKLDPFKNKP